MSDVGKTNVVHLNTSVKSLSKPLVEKSNQISDEKLREVSDLYENHFIREMIKQMRSTVHESGLIKQNNAEKIFQGQLDDEYANQWGKAGGIGLSNIIYEQLLDKFGAKMGLKQQLEKPNGPIEINDKSNFTALTVGAVKTPSAANLDINSEPITFRLESTKTGRTELRNPWAGTLLDKNYREMDQMQYRIKHDNGLESLIMTQGTGMGPEHKMAPGDRIQTGQQLGWIGAESALYWTVKPSVSE